MKNENLTFSLVQRYLSDIFDKDSAWMIKHVGQVMYHFGGAQVFLASAGEKGVEYFTIDCTDNLRKEIKDMTKAPATPRIAIYSMAQSRKHAEDMRDAVNKTLGADNHCWYPTDDEQAEQIREVFTQVIAASGGSEIFRFDPSIPIDKTGVIAAKVHALYQDMNARVMEEAEG